MSNYEQTRDNLQSKVRLFSTKLVNFSHRPCLPSLILWCGFIKARSCFTNNVFFYEEITKWTDEESPVDIIYFDFQKAFDKVPHQKYYLKTHGTDWIEKWLIDRRQHVVVEISNWKSVLSGVPQFIIIYINDLGDLHKLVKWSEKWQMLLNFGKC